MAINVIFDGPPSHESGRFVEVENDHGESIRAGEWIKRDDGYWALRFDEIPQQAINHTHDARGDDPDCCAKCGLNIRAKIHNRLST